MKKIIKIFGHLSFCFGLVFLIILPVNKYSWMQDMDPSIKVEDPSGNNLIFSLVILAIITLIEFLIFIRAAKSERVFSMSLVIVAVLILSFTYMFA